MEFPPADMTLPRVACSLFVLVLWLIPLQVTVACCISGCSVTTCSTRASSWQSSVLKPVHQIRVSEYCTRCGTFAHFSHKKTLIMVCRDRTHAWGGMANTLLILAEFFVVLSSSPSLDESFKEAVNGALRNGTVDPSGPNMEDSPQDACPDRPPGPGCPGGVQVMPYFDIEKARVAASPSD